ncbi:MAG: YiiX/YebB-like N1pC/P60 family cysteine hydrolase [Ferruginibacter sp.]
MYAKFIPVILGCCIMFILAFQHSVPATLTGADDIENRINGYLQTGEELLKEGDIVVRMNHDPFSEFIRYFNKKDKRFSHAGIVIRDGKQLMICHMASEEGNPMKLMLKQKLAQFADPHHNYGYAIYRYTFTEPELDSMRRLLNYWCRLPVHFDTAFNLASDNELYCSEMVQKAILKSTQNRIKISSTSLNSLEANALRSYYKIPLKPGMQIIAIDDLYVNVACKNIAGFTY